MAAWQREVADYGDDYADDELYESETNDVVGSASQALSPLSQEERKLTQATERFCLLGPANAPTPRHKN